MPAQTITYSKTGANWTTATQANTEIESNISADLKTWYANAKTNNELTDFSVTLADSDTLVMTRTWSDDGWSNLSAREDEAAAVKAALESAGFTVTDIRSDYV